jgi:hypothetical protein
VFPAVRRPQGQRINMNLQLHTPFRLHEPEQIETTPRPTSCFLVYYDGSLTSVCALRAACTDAAPETRIIAVYLETVPLTQSLAPVSGKHPLASQAALAAAVVNAKTFGRDVETAAVECHIRGRAMVDLAEECGNATIYVGTDREQRDALADYVQALAPADVVLVPV